MIKCLLIAVSKWPHRHQIPKTDSLEKSKDEGTVRLKVNAQTVVLARKLINLSTCF